MKAIAIFELPDGSKPLKDAELAYMDDQNHYQWMRTKKIRELPLRPVKFKMTRRKG